MPRILIDNRPPQVVFQDGNALSDATMNFGSALVQAPLAANEIRRRRAADEVDQVFRQRAVDRQGQQDAMAQLWRTQDMERQGRLDARQVALDEEGRRRDQFKEAQALAQTGLENIRQGSAQRLAEREFTSRDEDRKADNTRQTAEMLGSGMGKAAELIGSLFGAGKQKPAINASTGWHKGDDGKYFRNGPDGELQIYDPSTGAISKAGGPPGSESPAEGEPAPATAAATPPGQMQQPGWLTKMLGGGTEGAFATAKTSEHGFAAVQEMKSGSGFLDVGPGKPWYMEGIKALAQLDEKTRDAELLAIGQRDPHYALQVIADLEANGVK